MQPITQWNELTSDSCRMVPDCSKALQNHFIHPDRFAPVMLSDNPAQPITLWADKTAEQCGEIASCKSLLRHSHFEGSQPLTLRQPLLDQATATVQASMADWGLGKGAADTFSGLVPVVAILLGLWLAWKVLGWPLRRWSERQRAIEAQQGTLHGSSRHATRGDLEHAGMIGKQSSGLLIGRSGEGWGNQLVRYPGDAHLITFAPTGSGKGVSAVLPNLLDYQGSVICIDPKGENAAITARRRREMGQDVYLLDPWGLAGKETSSFNPLIWLDPDGATFEEDAMMLADTLVMEGTGDHWGKEAVALIAGVLMHIAASEPDDKRNLLQLNHLLALPPAEFGDLLKAMSKSPVEAVQRFAGRFSGKAPNEASGVMSSAQSHLHFLESRAMKRVLSRSDFDPLKLKQKPMTIYLILPAERLSSHARWLRLMVSLFLAALARNKTRADKPVLFMLDEFAALGRLQMIETAMGLMRGYGVKLWPILQDLSQLRANYRDKWESFVANAGAIQVFGTNDQSTADYFSRMAGVGTVTAEAGNDHGSSWNRQGRPLFMPDEIRRIDRVNQLLFVQGMHPCMVGKAFYYDMSEFKGMYDPNPYRDG